MADPKIEISNPKGMSKSDFESLQGTALYVRMFKHRCFIKVVGGLNSARDAARKEITEWLRANCNTLYYLPTGELQWVYIEGAADAVNFKMRFHDQDVTIPEPPAPPKPKAAPAQPKPVGISPPAGASKKEVAEWMKILQDGRAPKAWTSDLDGYDDLVDDLGISPAAARTIIDHINKKSF